MFVVLVGLLGVFCLFVVVGGFAVYFFFLGVVFWVGLLVWFCWLVAFWLCWLWQAVWNVCCVAG